jgi:prepilin-type N-terminal cleavage/methylation domain-containing protein
MIKMKQTNKGFTLVELLTVIIVIGLIASLSFGVVTKKINESKQKSYDTLISNIIDASKDYMLEKETDVDKYHLNTLCISIEELQNTNHIEKGEIKNPKNNELLTGFVEVKYDSNNKQYKYTYVDSCTETNTVPISQTILSNEEIKLVNSTDGLYETSDNYIYKGTNPNNYLRFNNNIWRIISIDKETNMIKIINLNGSQHTWQENGMINYLNNDYEEGTTYTAVKDIININSKWNAGNIDNLDSSLSLLSQEKQITEYYTIGLLNVSEYIDASLVNNCFENNSCTSYLSNNKNYWLLDKTNENKYWYVKDDNKLYNISPTNDTLYNVYPVLYLKINTIITKGKGTELEPYEI